MEIKNFMIGIVLVTIIALAFSGFIGNAAVRYDVTFEDTFLENTFNKTTQLAELQNNLDAQLDQNTTTGSGSFYDIVGSYLGRGIELTKFAATSYDIFEGFIAASAEKLNIPGYMITALIIIVLISIVMGAIAALLTGRVKP